MSSEVKALIPSQLSMRTYLEECECKVDIHHLFATFLDGFVRDGFVLKTAVPTTAIALDDMMSVYSDPSHPGTHVKVCNNTLDGTEHTIQFCTDNVLVQTIEPSNVVPDIGVLAKFWYGVMLTVYVHLRVNSYAVGNPNSFYPMTCVESALTFVSDRVFDVLRELGLASPEEFAVVHRTSPITGEQSVIFPYRDVTKDNEICILGMMCMDDVARKPGYVQLHAVKDDGELLSSSSVELPMAEIGFMRPTDTVQYLTDFSLRVAAMLVPALSGGDITFDESHEVWARHLDIAQNSRKLVEFHFDNRTPDEIGGALQDVAGFLATLAGALPFSDGGLLDEDTEEDNE